VVGVSLPGAPVLIDGFANGWRIDPATLGSVIDHGTITVALQWKPQQRVDIALIISLVAIVACLVLVFVPVRIRRRRRPKGRHSAGRGEGDPSADDAVGAGVVGTVEVGSEPPSTLVSVPLPSPVSGATEISPEESAPEVSGDAAGPRLVVPFRSEAPRAPLWLALVGGLVMGVVAGVIASPVAGVAVGIATAVVLLVPALRAVLGLLAVAGVVAAGVYVAVHQGQDHVPAGGNWPLSFNSASKLAWAGVVFLGADGAVEMIQRGSSALRRRATGGSGTSEGSHAEAVSGPDHLLPVDPGDGPEVAPGA
jgi:arabinofuranan 3-O-arabinosyltransferase